MTLFAPPMVGDLIWYSRERNGETVHCWRVAQRMFTQRFTSGSHFTFEVVPAPIREAR